jgi:hypothetical protein
MKTIYSMSERLLFTLIPPANLAVLMASPFLLRVWLHKGGLFSAAPYTVMALISSVMSIKEHKHQFQYSTNRHEEMARFVFASYVAMVAISYGLIPHFGYLAFLWCWLATELTQTVYIICLNFRLLAGKVVVERAALLQVAALIAAGTILAGSLTKWMESRADWLQLAVTAICVLSLLGVGAWIFRVRDVTERLARRMGLLRPAVQAG